MLHAHGYKAGGLALPVARMTRAPLVVTWHNAVLGSGRSGDGRRGCCSDWWPAAPT